MPESWRPLAEGKPLPMDRLPWAAQELLKAAGDRKVWIFYGDMGSGKTTLIKVVCGLLGVSDAMSSPTFSIVNEYQSMKGKIFHFDFYRIRHQAEAMDIGTEEYLDSGNYCFVEWPEKILGLLPDSVFKVKISHEDKNTRKIEFAS